MTINYNLHRFGNDEFAVGHLINGDLPEDDEERWRIVDAPRYRIQKLFDEHLSAQATLRECSDSGRPFVLFLRSFSSEHQTHRIGKDVASHISLHSVSFQQWLRLQLPHDETQIIKLHGGSDSFISDIGNDAKVLSTHSANWKAVAEELVQAASAIVFLVSHITAGVAEEFDLIRKFGQMHRCLVVMLDASDTPNRDAAEMDKIHARLIDFPNVFELQPRGTIAATSYPEELAQILKRLLRNAKTEMDLEQAFKAEFSYLEPDFIDSKDFETTETLIWRKLRLLRVMFENTYWAALKSHGIAFQHFTFPGAWKIAHQIYGLAVATADFRAIREALSYLSILYVARGADFALLIKPLAGQYGELAERIFQAGVSDIETKYTSTPDPLKFPARIDVSLELFQHAESAGQRQDSETAVYLYQAAVIIALQANDRDDYERNWIIANMCRDWAKFQGESDQLAWAVTNCAFAAKLFRDLATADPDRYNADLSLCLNNLGSMHFRLRDFVSSEAAYVEALEIRRAVPSESEGYLVNLYTSLSNLGLLRVEIGELDSARTLYSEALAICEKRLISVPGTIVDLTRLQGWMSLCLAQISDARHEGLEYAQRAVDNLAKVSQISSESAASLQELVDAAVRANS